MKTLLTSLFLILITTNSYAELYRDIGPLDSLGDIKAKFPHASYEPVKAAWVTESDALYKITGQGLNGTIVVKFSDSRPIFRKMLLDNPDGQNNDVIKKFSEESDAEALSVGWVRWVPDTEIPLQRFILKYGNPEKSGFDDEDMSPYKSWEAKGLTAYLSDNGNHVVRVDFSFTKNEQRQAWKNKKGAIPPWLQAPENNPKKKSNKSFKTDTEPARP